MDRNFTIIFSYDILVIVHWWMLLFGINFFAITHQVLSERKSRN